MLRPLLCFAAGVLGGAGSGERASPESSVHGAAEPQLPALRTGGSVTVSGLSAGAFMAVQLHVAYSSAIAGAGVVAGGPYYCAEGNVATALNACMKHPERIDVARLATWTENAAAIGSIDRVAHLGGSRVWVYSGTNDTTVAPGVARQLERFYALFRANVTSKLDLPGGHNMPTSSFGTPCGESESPYIGDCSFDGAFAILSAVAVNGSLTRGEPGDAVPANLLSYDQARYFAPALPAAVGLASSGFVYVPTRCRSGGCPVHVALHGCLQSVADVGSTFATHAGYNPHAERNGLVILYPQAHTTALNPKSCFDWWGYTGPAYASQLGVQPAAIKRMLDRLAA